MLLYALVSSLPVGNACVLGILTLERRDLMLLCIRQLTFFILGFLLLWCNNPNLLPVVNSAIGILLLLLVSFSMPKSVVLVFLSPPCCTAMPCQPEVTGFVVLTLKTQILKPLASSHAHTVFYLCSSHWLHFFHILVSPVWSMWTHVCNAVCTSDLLILPLTPIGILQLLLVELWSFCGLPLGCRHLCFGAPLGWTGAGWREATSILPC